MHFKRVILFCLPAVLISCTDIPVKKQDVAFKVDEQSELYKQKSWAFSGRFALSTQTELISASINWKHSIERDEIELSGPFGQGRTLVTFVDNAIEIDSGEQKNQYFGQVDDLVHKHLGIDVPVSALKYWVLGLVDLNHKYTQLNDGFIQSEWQVQYLSMQQVQGYELPKKMKINSNVTHFKLILNQWDIK